MVVFLQIGCFRVKSSCIRVKVLFSRKWLYSCKVVVFGQKSLYSRKSCYFRTKLLYSGKVVVFGIYNKFARL